MKHISLLISFLILTSNLFAIKITNLADINGNEAIITEIDLSNKGIIKFPEKILECKNLQILNLSENGFVDIPYELTQLEHLKVLDLSENHNLSPLDIEVVLDSALFQLEELNISDCALFYLPDAIGDQKQLKHLDISRNYIRVLPYRMQLLSNIESLNLADNKLINISWLSGKWWSLKEIDVSGNETLETEGLLINLSFMDNIEKLTISHLSVIPEQFKYFMGKELVIKDSEIPEFPRHEYSSKINKITFDNCQFPDPGVVVNVLNELVDPDHISFRNMDQKSLVPFLKLNVDSLDLKGNDLTNINPITGMEKVKWVDVRANNITDQSLDYVQTNRPDIKLYSTEPVQASFGISPPFQEMIPAPEIVAIAADEPQEVLIGRTVFDIPKNAFLTESGEVYDGQVEIEYTEYMTPADIFYSGISMTSTDESGEVFMLSSGGMFNFEAKDEQGNELQANPSQPIQASVMTQNTNTQMDTWQMTNGAWVNYGQNDMNEMFKLDQTLLDSIMEVDYGTLMSNNVEFVRNRYVPNISKGDRLKDFEISFDILKTARDYKKMKVDQDGNLEVYNQEYHSEFISQISLIYDGENSEADKEFLEGLEDFCHDMYKPLRLKGDQKGKYSQMGPNYISELKLTPDYENDNMDLTFLWKDSLVNIPVLFKTRTKHFSATPREITTYFNRYQTNYKKYVKEKKKHYFKIKPFIKKRSTKMRKRAVEAEKRRQRWLFDNRFNNININIGSTERSVTLTGFGLWNCDARMRMEKPKQIAENYSVAGEMINDDVEMITVIDKANNGCINFNPETEDKFFDSGSKSIILVFFAGAGLGIFQSWMHNMQGNTMELRLYDPETQMSEIDAIIQSDI